MLASQSKTPSRRASSARIIIPVRNRYTSYPFVTAPNASGTDTRRKASSKLAPKQAQTASGIRLGLANIAATVDAAMVQVTRGAGDRPRNIEKITFFILDGIDSAREA